MADDTPPLPNQTFIQSREPAANSYGQNGYQGPSSVLPGEKQPAQSKFAPKADEAKAILAAGGMSFAGETRKIEPSPEKTAYGHKASTPNPAKVPAGGRPVTTDAPQMPRLMKSLTGKHN